MFLSGKGSKFSTKTKNKNKSNPSKIIFSNKNEILIKENDTEINHQNHTADIVRG